MSASRFARWEGAGSWKNCRRFTASVMVPLLISVFGTIAHAEYFSWAKRAGGTGSDFGNGIAVDGDGMTDVAVWRPGSGVWYIQKSSDVGMLSPQWGLGSLGDVPIKSRY